MKLFLDTANIEEIKKSHEWGVIDGVTTNPSWIARDAKGKSFEDVVKEICNIVKGPVSAEVVATTYDEMMREAEQIATWAPNVIIKIPLIPEGIKATRALTEKGIKTNVTLCSSANQALLAAKVGATYISPFIGRLVDAGLDGVQLVRDIVTIYKNYGFKTKVLAASFRNPSQIVEVAKAGADVATIKFVYLEQMFKSPFTDVGLAAFLEDAKKWRGTM